MWSLYNAYKHNKNAPVTLFPEGPPPPLPSSRFVCSLFALSNEAGCLGGSEQETPVPRTPAHTYGRRNNSRRLIGERRSPSPLFSSPLLSSPLLCSLSSFLSDWLYAVTAYMFLSALWPVKTPKDEWVSVSTCKCVYV